MGDSIIEHNDHPILCPEANLAGESDLTPDQMELLNNYTVMVSSQLTYLTL